MCPCYAEVDIIVGVNESTAVMMMSFLLGGLIFGPDIRYTISSGIPHVSTVLIRSYPFRNDQ